MNIFEYIKAWLFPSPSLDQLVREYEEVAPIPKNYVSPYPYREPDEAMEIVSQPLDGERHPKVQEMTRELTGIEPEM
jgi:hypothetical protein